MSEGYWIYKGLEETLGIDRKRHIIKSPDSMPDLLRLLHHKRGNHVKLTPRFLQRGNHFEFVTLYENDSRKVAERYAFASICDKPVKELMHVITLAKGLEDCADENEKQLWLRIAAPVADSSVLLRKEFQIVNSISHNYLEKNKHAVLDDAHERKIMYHVHSSYLDKEQAVTELALKHAF